MKKYSKEELLEDMRKLSEMIAKIDEKYWGVRDKKDPTKIVSGTMEGIDSMSFGFVCSLYYPGFTEGSFGFTSAIGSQTIRKGMLQHLMDSHVSFNSVFKKE